jgi:hypothetical protein
MKKKSFETFSDDETRRRLRHWFASHPQATEADSPEALTVLDRPPSWRDVNAALEPFGARKSVGTPDHLADFVAQLAVARGAKRLLDPFAKSPTMIAALAEYLPTAQATALAPADWTIETGRAVAPDVRWQGGDPPESLVSLDGPFDFIAATPPLGLRKGRFPIRSGLGEYSHSLVIDVAELLAPDGCLAVLVSDGFFFRADARRTQLPSQNSGGAWKRRSPSKEACGRRATSRSACWSSPAAALLNGFSSDGSPQPSTRAC